MNRNLWISSGVVLFFEPDWRWQGEIYWNILVIYSFQEVLEIICISKEKEIKIFLEEILKWYLLMLILKVNIFELL